MSCEIREIKAGEKWDEFVVSQKHAQFLQSSAWKIFQEKLGRPCKIVAYMDGEKILAGGLFISLPLPLTYSYVYTPRGPIGGWGDIDAILGHIIHTKDSQTLFVRIEPPIFPSDSHCIEGKKTRPHQVEYTLLLDCLRSEEELLKAMHPKTRYNIRLSEKRRVRLVRIQAGDTNSDRSMETFIDLLRLTAERDMFHIHTAEHYRALFNIIPSYLYCAFLEEEMIAAILVVHFGDTVTYLHGASSDHHRNLMAPYLLQWEAIKDTKKMGKCYYDFWGVAPSDDPRHPWSGITRFKKGFGGSVYQYPGTFEIPLNTFLYQCYNFGKFFSKVLS